MFIKGERLCILLLFLYLPSSAQITIGIEGGFSSNYLNTNISNRIPTVIHADMGFKAGIPIQFEIQEWLFAEIEPEILQKNYLIDRTGLFKGIYKKVTNTYLQLPVTVGSVYGKRLKIFANAGFYAGHWLSGKVKGRIPDIFSANPERNDQSENFKLVSYNQRYSFDPKKDKRCHLIWQHGIVVKIYN